MYKLISVNKNYILEGVVVINDEKHLGFTLAEVLITLGIIGVVAAITIPTLMTKVEESVLVRQLKAAHSIFSRAYKMAINEEGDPLTWDIGDKDTAEGALKLYKILTKYLKVGEQCETREGCFYEGDYKALFSPKWRWHPGTHNRYARGILSNGMSFLFWSNGSGCPNDQCGSVMVDINGYKKPNQAGVDYFAFTIRKDGSIRGSDTILEPNAYGETCKHGDTSDINGKNCTAWVLQMGNMDYRRRDITNDWKRFKGVQ